jgi:hypothetical protein
MAEKKAFLLRIDSALWAQSERLARAACAAPMRTSSFRCTMRWRGVISKRCTKATESESGD